MKEGKLNSFQFGTLMLYWTATEYHVAASEIESIPLFLPCESNPDGLKINPIAFEYIKQTMKGGSENFPDYIHLTDDQIVEMLEKMKEAPLSEQQILIAPQFIKTTTVGTRIKENGVNIFRDFNIQNPDGTTTNKRMIAPITLKQAFLNVKFKEQAVNIQVVLSNSSLRDISLNAITNSRDMGIPYPSTTLNPKADHFPAPGIEYPDHDFFHALMASLVPLPLRFATSRAALVAGNSLPFEKNANAFKNHLLDLEFTLFREESRKADEHEGHTFIKEVIMRLKPPEGFLSPKDVRIQQLFDVLIDIMHHEEEWKTEFGITKEDIAIDKIKAYVLKTIKDISSSDHQQIIKLFYLLEEGRKAENLYLEGNENAGKQTVFSFLIFIRQYPPLSGHNKSCQIDILDYQHVFFAAFKNPQILKMALEHYKTATQLLSATPDLILKGCKNLTDEHLDVLVGASYTKIDLSACTTLTPQALNKMSHLSFKSLKLTACPHLIKGLTTLPSDVTFPSVEELDLSTYKFITQEIIESIVQKFPNLKVIKLNFTNVTEKMLIPLGKLQLQELSIQNCKFIKTLDFSRFILSLKNLLSEGCPIPLEEKSKVNPMVLLQRQYKADMQALMKQMELLNFLMSKDKKEQAM